MVEIIPMDKKDLKVIADVMWDSFKDDLLYKYFISDEGKRIKFLKGFMTFRLKYGLKYGEVYITTDRKGVAIWLSSEEKMKFKDLILLGGFLPMIKCGPKAMKVIVDFNDYADDIKGKAISGRYWHLSPIAVCPKYQGKGYGKALILHKLSQIDKNGERCFLETQSVKNGEIYSKYGFDVMSVTDVPNSHMKHIAMVRNLKK